MNKYQNKNGKKPKLHSVSTVTEFFNRCVIYTFFIIVLSGFFVSLNMHGLRLRNMEHQRVIILTSFWKMNNFLLTMQTETKWKSLILIKHF